MSILSSSYWWTQHINWLIISLPPYGLRLGWVRAAAAPVRAPLIRTIIPSPSWGPVTKNGVAPSARLVSPRPDYERQGVETAVWFSRHRWTHRAITPDESWQSQVEVEGKWIERRQQRGSGIERWKVARVKILVTERGYRINEVNIDDFWIDWVRGCTALSVWTRTKKVHCI